MSLQAAYRGPNKSGKTTAALSWPNPVLFDFDLRTEGVSPDVMSKVIAHHRFGVPISIPKSGNRPGVVKILQGWREQYDAFLIKYQEVLKDSKVDSIVLDTATQMRQMVNQSYLQELQEARPDNPRERLIPIEYTEPNNRLRAIYNAARSADKNLILTHYEEEEYKDHIDSKGDVHNVPTGKMLLAGFNKTEGIVDLVIRTTLEQRDVYDEGGRKTGTKQYVPVGEVLLSGLCLELNGMSLEYPGYDTIAKWMRVFRPGWQG